MAGYTSLLSKHQREKVAELRKQYVSDVSFLKAVNQHFKERQRKRGQGKEGTNLSGSLKGIDPLFLIDAIFTDPNSNDIAVECSLFLKTIIASINHNNKKSQVTVVLPSPQFIYHWCRHPMLSSTTVTFVVKNSTVCDVLRSSKYIKGKPITFHEYDDTQRSRWFSRKIPPAHVFAVNHSETAANPLVINQIISAFTSKKLLNPHCTIVGFFGRKEFEENELSSHLPSNSTLKGLSLQSIAYLPRKIALSTSPRSKIIIQAKLELCNCSWKTHCL